MSETNPPSLAAQLMVPRIIFAALVVSVLIYGGVGWLVTSQNPAPPSGTPAAAKYVFVGLGAMTAMMSFVVRAVLLGRLSGSAPAGSGESYRLSAMINNSGRIQISPAVEKKFFTAYLAGLALCESAAIFGLVQVVMFKDLTVLFGMVALAVLAMAAHFPREKTLLDLQRAADQKTAGSGIN